MLVVSDTRSGDTLLCRAALHTDLNAPAPLYDVNRN